MTSKERLSAAASFKEADRVPVELEIGAKERKLPECRRIADFVDNKADNFRGIAGVNWGFFGLPCEYREEITEDIPGEYRRLKRVYSTPAGEFFALTKHSYPHLDNPDYNWEKRYISTLEDLERLTEAERRSCSVLADDYFAGVKKIGGRGLPYVARLHPLGLLVRWSKIEEVYGWLISEPTLMHRFLERTNRQVCETIIAMGGKGIAPWFMTWAHEMLVPPWLGRRHFDELVFPYDKAVHDTIHQIGGKVRAHCHGKCINFLRPMADMGIDAIEPLEPEPWGDVDLKQAKRLVGGRMLLSGNIPSQNFLRMSREDVKESVKNAVSDAGQGGGFTLRTTGGDANVDFSLDRDMLKKIIENTEAYIEAGLKYGEY
ncbi:MAG: hypothetical protein JW957_08945 [Candidatus Omnitrophica bacterium]|nr:hypothetical protein [Candidatus Omnitrophota bacterium]